MLFSIVILLIFTPQTLCNVFVLRMLSKTKQTNHLDQLVKLASPVALKQIEILRSVWLQNCCAAVVYVGVTHLRDVEGLSQNVL